MTTKIKPPSGVERKHFTLRVIEKPEEGTRTVLLYDGPGTIIIKGEHPGVSYDCGNCESPLIVDIEPGQVRNLVLRCRACGAYNESPD